MQYLEQSLVKDDDSKHGGGQDLELVGDLVGADVQVLGGYVQQVVLDQVDHGGDADL